MGETRGDVHDTKKVDAHRRLVRIIVDENAGPGSPVWNEYQSALANRPAEDGNAGKQAVEYLFLKDAHPGIPDVEILDKLLGPDAILLTGDRPLHAQAIARGIRAYTLNELGQITRRPVARFHAAKLPQSVHHELQSDYRYQPGSHRPEHLLTGLTDKQVKKYRTARRRIRALRDLYWLQLDQVPAELFILPPDTLQLCHDARTERQFDHPLHEALRQLFRGIHRVTLKPCNKGPFFDAMTRKLNQLSTQPSNEVTEFCLPS